MSSIHRPLALSLALTLGVSACDLELTGINENPNAPTDVPAASILPEGITSAASLALGYNLNLDLTEHWVQHISEIQYAEEDLYQFRSDEVDAAWRAFYSGPLVDFQRVIEKGEETEQPNVVAVGRIMQAWTWLIMTDMWGDLPYFEALRGQDEEQIIQPAYTPQAEIYADLLNTLTEASQMIDVGGACPFGAADLIYGCNMERWQEFANSLRLRIAVRLAGVDPSTAAAEAAAAVAAGVFDSNADNAALYYVAQPNQNPWFEAIDPSVGGRPGDFRVSATLIDTLKALDDPRLPVYANPIEASAYTSAADCATQVPVSAPFYRGMPAGLEEHCYQLSQTSTIGASLAAAQAPAVLMSYSEVLFLLAEAAQRQWIPGVAAAYYREAIEASMDWYDIPQAQIQAYLLQPEVQYDAANWRASIGLQKWIALFGNGPEAYAEWRRLGYPILTPGADAELDQLPLRYPYADSEFVYNEANLQAAIARQGGAELLDPVWWDVTP